MSNSFTLGVQTGVRLDQKTPERSPPERESALMNNMASLALAFSATEQHIDQAGDIANGNIAVAIHVTWCRMNEALAHNGTEILPAFSFLVPLEHRRMYMQGSCA